MAFSILRQIFGDLENANEDEKRTQGRELVRVMFLVAILGIIASLAIPYLKRNGLPF